jgi:hypothetical protein
MNDVNQGLLTFLAIITLTVVPASNLHADDDDIFDSVRNLVEQAFGVDASVEAVNAVVPGENAGGALPGEKDINEYRSRLQDYSQAMQHWLTVMCPLSEAQQNAVKEFVDAEILKSTKAFAEAPDGDRQQQIFPVTFPMVFTLKAANRAGRQSATDFSERVMLSIRTDVLNAEQQARVDVALKERDDFQRLAFIEYLVAQSDDELFLTTAQRQEVSTALADRKPSISHPLYLFNAQSYYLPYESMSGILSNASVGKILDNRQKKRLLDLNNADPNSQHIIFQSSAGRDGWYVQMNEAGLKERQKFLNAAAVRVAYYEKELSLSAEQAEFLTSASKGAAVRAVNDWKESTEQTFESMEQQMAQMGGDFGFGASSMDVRTIENNQIWKDALSTCNTKLVHAAEKLRKAALRQATGNSVLALMDNELWLLPEQRTSLLPLIVKSLPDNSSPFQYQEYIREVVLIAHPLFLVREKSRDEILDVSQQNVWKTLQGFFQLQKENNYVQIQLRNNGASFGFMLAP